MIRTVYEEEFVQVVVLVRRQIMPRIRNNHQNAMNPMTAKMMARQSFTISKDPSVAKHSALPMVVTD